MSTSALRDHLAQTGRIQSSTFLRTRNADKPTAHHVCDARAARIAEIPIMRPLRKDKTHLYHLISSYHHLGHEIPTNLQVLCYLKFG